MIRKHHLFIIFSFISSAVLLYIATKDVRIDDVLTVIGKAHWEMALPLLLSYAIHYWLKLLRWRYLLQPLCNAKLSDLFSPMMLGFFANNLLPARLGEFVRMYLGAKTLSLNYTQVLAGIILERILDILVVILFFGITLAIAQPLSANFKSLGLTAALLAFIIIFSLVCLTRWTQPFLRLFKRLLSIVPSHIDHKIYTHVEFATHALQALRGVKRVGAIVLTSIAQWLFMIIAIYVSLLSVNINVGVVSSILVLVFTVIAVTVPSAPGFFGSIQAAFVFALIHANVLESDAIAASIFFHFFTYSSVTLLGFYLLKKLNTNLSQMKMQTESAKHEIEESLG